MTDDSFPTAPGVHRLAHEGGRLAVSIPRGYRHGAAAPLVLALHWGGEDGPWLGEALLVALVKPALREIGAVLAAPDCRDGRWADPAGEAQLLALLDQLQPFYGAGPERTLVTGYSMGGVGSWYLAARRPERFAAALPISARPPAEAMDARLPLYIIHARHDELFAVGEAEAAARALQARGGDVTFQVVEEVTHYQMRGFVAPLRAAAPWITRQLKLSEKK